MANSKCRIEILPRAWEDLTSIEDYYYLQFDIESAQKVSDSILSSIEILEDFPDIDVLTPDKRLNQLGYRMYIITEPPVTASLPKNRRRRTTPQSRFASQLPFTGEPFGVHSSSQASP